MSEFVKSIFDGLDKVTDILNVGRLIFYTAAGYCGLLPVAMSLRLLGHSSMDPAYWTQFYTDFIRCTTRLETWLAAVIFGFIIANLVNAVVFKQFNPAPSEPIKPDSYPYQYPRLFSGGIKPATNHDYAAWLISEYYRYLEIAVFIPYSILLSLPVYALYSLMYLLRAPGPAADLVPHASHYAFAVWILAAVFAWTVGWPAFWIPRVAEPIYHDWVKARRAAIQGLQDFIRETESQQTTTPPSNK